MDRTLKIRLEDTSASQLSNFLRRFADCQVAGACLSVLDLAVGGNSHPFFGRFVGFLLSHNSMIFRIFEGKEFNDPPNFIQGQKRRVNRDFPSFSSLEQSNFAIFDPNSRVDLRGAISYHALSVIRVRPLTTPQNFYCSYTERDS